MIPRSPIRRAALAALCALCVGVPAASAVERTWEPATVPWAAYEVGADERSVLVGYSSECGDSRNTAASVAEARESVTITVRDEFAIRPEGQRTLCKPPHVRFLTVELQRPLGGRELVGALGESPTNLVCGSGCPGTASVPGLVGFSLRDARTALELAGLVAVVRHGCSGSRGRRGVVSQTPEREHRVPERARVRLCVAKT